MRAFGFVRSKQSEMGGTGLESLLRIPGAEAKIIRMGLGEQTIELVGIKPEVQASPQKFRRGALCFNGLNARAMPVGTLSVVSEHRRYETTG
jgi:hypothetical protein